MDKQKIGKRLKEFRELVGLSQAALADKAKVARTTVTHWESGKREMDSTSLAMVSVALGLDSDILLGLPDRPFGRTVHDRIQNLLHAEGAELAARVIGVPEEAVIPVGYGKLLIHPDYFKAIAQAYNVPYGWLMTGSRRLWSPSLKSGPAGRLRFLRILTGIQKTEVLEPYWTALERSDQFFRDALKDPESHLNKFMLPMLTALLPTDENSLRALRDDREKPPIQAWDWVVAGDLDEMERT